MNNVVLKLKKLQLNNNQLKIIAIITMILDHIGYYFAAYINDTLYYILRAIGRTSMPIFSFLIVQGFFHTRDIKKYILKVFSTSLITQICIFIVSLFDKSGIKLSVNNQLNILFSYTLSLIVLWLVHNKNIIDNVDNNTNMFFKIFMIIIIIGVYVFIPMDYGIYVPILIVGLYFIERLKITVYINRQSYDISMKNIALSMLSEEHIKAVYNILIFISFIIVILQSNNKIYWYMLFSLFPIYLYNGEKGRKDKKLDIFFYLVFPLQHFLIYLLSII